MRRRSLFPREHGTYFQLAIPLAVAAVEPTVIGIALTIAAVLLFLANEPLRVMLGLRGPRMRERDGTRARRRFLVLAMPGALCGAVAIVLAPPIVWLACALVALVAGAVAACVWRAVIQTLAGELVAAIALTGAAVPVRIAGGTPLPTALAEWLGWSLGFGATIIAVRRVIERHGGRATHLDVEAGLALAGAAAVCLAIAPAMLALVAIAAVIVVMAPRATHLRAIGVVVAVTAAACGVLEVA